MGNRPTEADLGIDLTPEEQEVLARPVTQLPEDDISQSESEENDTLVQAKPKAEDKPEETAEAKATRERDEAGKFVAKPKEGEAAPKVEAPAEERKVDLRALQEARAENKLLMERMTTLLEAQQRRETAKAEAEKPAPVIPDKTTDPLGYIDYIEQRLGKIEGETQAQKDQREAYQAEQNEMAQVLAVAQPQFDEAAKADPALRPIYNALLGSFAREIAFNNGIPMDANGVPIAPQHQQWVAGELKKIEDSHIKYAVQTRQDFATYTKGLAQARGIAVQAAPAQAEQPATPAAPAKTIAERVAAQSRHMSIGDLPGSALPDKISAKDLVKMSSAEFAAFAKKMGDKDLDKMFLDA
jgi:hypothetical protein